MKLSPSTLHFCLASIRNKKLAIATFTALSLLGWSSDASAATVYWNQAGTGGAWTSSLWGTSASGPFTGAWATSNDVVFGGSAPAAITFATTTVGNITVDTDTTVSQAGTLTWKLGGGTVNVASGKTLTWTSQSWTTAAAQIITKSGSGTWNIGAQGGALAAGSSFTLGAGTVIVSGNNSFGGTNSALNINGGTIQSSGTRAFANSAITIGGDFTNQGTGIATYSGTVWLGGVLRTITNDTASGSRVYSGVVSNYGSNGITFTATTQGATGTGTTNFTNATNTFSGPITISNGEVIFASSNSLGNVNNSIVIDGGRLTMTTGDIASTHAISLGSTVSSGTATGTAISVTTSGTTNYNGVLADKTSSTGILVKQGAGTLILGGVNTYTGQTSINNGTLKLTTGSNRLPTSTVVSLGQASSTNLGILDLNGQNQQIAGLVSTTGTNATGTKNTVTSTAAATLDINVADGATSSYGAGTAANSGAITGAISLKKSGLGTQTLGDTNTYTGTTTVDAGKLVINGSISTSTTTVKSAGTLAGSGTVGAVTVNSGGFIAPGNSPGILNTGNIILEAGSTLGIEIDGATVATQYDRLNVTGSVSLAGLLSMTMSGSYAPANGTLFFILANDGTDAITGTFSNASVNGGTYTLGGQKFQISYAGDTTTSSFTGGNDVVLQAVPEPASLLLGAVAILTLLRRRR